MAMERLEKHYIHHNLRALLESPDFRGYDNLDKHVLQPPPPVRELPCGPDHAVHKHMLKTVDIEETSYEGNDKVIAEWYRQLGILDKARSVPPPIHSPIWLRTTLSEHGGSKIKMTNESSIHHHQTCKSPL